MENHLFSKHLLLITLFFVSTQIVKPACTYFEAACAQSQGSTCNNSLMGTETSCTSQAQVVQDSIKVVEVSPEFPGGLQALTAFIQQNKIIPVSHKSTGISGKVHVKFTINVDGSISNAQILKSLNEACDKEALRLISIMPNWKPGTVGGEPVVVHFFLPIKF